MGTKLDLGGINKLNGKDGWLTVNCGAGTDCDVEADITEIDHLFPDGSVEYMLCSHTFEHLMCSQTEAALWMWHRKLIPDGKLELIMPDGGNIVDRYAKGEVAWLTVMNVLYGVPEWLRENRYLQHLYAYSFDSLKELVERCGYKVIERRKRDWPHNYANEKGLPYYGKFRVNDLHIVAQKVG